MIFTSTAKGQSSGTAVMVKKGRGINVYRAIKTDSNDGSFGVEVIYQNKLCKLVSVCTSNDAVNRRELFATLRQYVDTPCRTVLGDD